MCFLNPKRGRRLPDIRNNLIQYPDHSCPFFSQESGQSTNCSLPLGTSLIGTCEPRGSFKVITIPHDLILRAAASFAFAYAAARWGRLMLTTSSMTSPPIESSTANSMLYFWKMTAKTVAILTRAMRRPKQLRAPSSSAGRRCRTRHGRVP
jgi:hypothetical protein